MIDYKALPPRIAAALFVGLPPDSRIMRKLSGRAVDNHTALLAIIADRLGLLLWAQTKDGQKGRNRPKSIFEAITNGGGSTARTRGYTSVAEFEAARAKILSERSED